MIRDYCGRVGGEIAEPSVPIVESKPAAKTKKRK
jgi:hypothetical protein